MGKLFPSMSNFDKKSFDQLAKLVRIECTEDERNSLIQDISSILDNMKLLEEIDTTDVEPCDHVLKDVVNVMREDQVGELMERDSLIENAPSHTGGMVRVPPVIKNQN